MRNKSSWVNYRVARQTLVVVAVLVSLRALLFAFGFTGIPLTTMAGSIIAGAVFVMGLVVAGTMSDYKEAERAPSDLASGLYAILRDGEAIHHRWGGFDIGRLRSRLVAVVDGLRRDIDAGGTREAQTAIEGLNRSFAQIERTDAPDGRVLALRSHQNDLRKAVLRVYHIQREEFLPSAWVMINSFVFLILGMLMLSSLDSPTETLVTLGFFTFFFVYLLRLLTVIDKPFKIGERRGQDDVSLFLLYEFVVHATTAEADIDADEVVDIAAKVEAVEEGNQEHFDDTRDIPVADLRDRHGDLRDLGAMVEAVTSTEN